MPAQPTTQSIPGPLGFPVSGNLYRLNKDILNCLLKDHLLFGDIMKYRIGTSRYIVLNHPDSIRYVLHENKSNYSKETLSNEESKHITGDSLLTLQGDAWHQQRRRMQGAFRKGAVSSYLPEMKNEVDSLIQRWYQQTSTTINITREMSALTYSIVGKSLLGSNLHSSKKEIFDSLDTALTYIYSRIDSLIRLPILGFTRKQRQFTEAIRQFDHIIIDIIKQRAENKTSANDLLSVLTAAVDDQDNSQMNPQQLRNELVTLLLAGHETTANLMTWCLYELSSKPELQQKLYDEVKNIDLDTINVNQLYGLEQIYCVIQETLRLYPPVWLMERRTLETDRIADYKIPKHSTVILSAWIMHRHPEYWQNPDQFDPSRFAQNNLNQLPEYVYIPFGKGPRMCIGMNFALQEAMIILAKIIQYCILSNRNPVQAQPTPSITLRPPESILLNIKSRIMQ